MYSKEVMKHFSNPKNFGEMKDPDGVGKVGNIICGDIMWLYIKVKEKKGKKTITDVKFKTLGCAAAIASSSMTTVLVKGKTVEEALAITKEDVLKALSGLPPMKVHCSLLATEALAEAVYDYLKKNNLEIPKFLQEHHERIEKENKEAEKKYEEFMKSQEQMLSCKK